MIVTKVRQMYGNVSIVWKRYRHKPWKVEGRGISIKYKRKSVWEMEYPFGDLSLYYFGTNSGRLSSG